MRPLAGRGWHSKVYLNEAFNREAGISRGPEEIDNTNGRVDQRRENRSRAGASAFL